MELPGLVLLLFNAKFVYVCLFLYYRHANEPHANNVLFIDLHIL